jgi:hypothetical protein
VVSKDGFELAATRGSQYKGLGIRGIGKTLGRSEQLEQLGAEPVPVYR